nr:putative ribonuclease H-like domain-containing protein [Tanacetum cinerariifolium]
GVRGDIGITTFRNALKAQYLPHSSMYVSPPPITIVRPWFATIGYNGEIDAKETLKKSFLPPRWRLLMGQIIQCLDYAKLIWEDLIHKLNKKTREKIIPYLRFISLLLEHIMPKYNNEELTINPTQDIRLQQIPQLKLIMDYLLLIIPYIHNMIWINTYSFDHIFAGSNPSVLVDKTKSAKDGLKTAHTESGSNEESKADDLSKKIFLQEDMDSDSAHMVAASKVPMLKPDKAQRRLEVKARSTLMLGIPNEHQLKFNSIKDAKQMMEAIEKGFELLGEKISQKDVNQKLLRSLSTEWNTHDVVWRNKAYLDTMSMDDLYNNLKVYEPEVKGMSSSNSSIQNIDFVSSSNNSSTNGAVNTANEVSTASTQVNHAFSLNIDNLSDVVICAFLTSQPNSPQLVHEDLEQIHPDDIEEIDLRWQIAMLTMRARRFLKKSRRKLTINSNETISFEKSNLECYNCNKRGHFSRECIASRNQENKHKKSTKRSVPMETTASIALVSCDDSKVSADSTCTKSCLETVKILKSQHKQLTKDLKKSELMVLGYKTGLESVEERLKFFKINESDYLKDIKLLKVQIQMKDIAIKELRMKLELAQKEKDGIQLKVDKFKNASKSLNKLIECQIVDNCKKGLRYESYNAVLPPYTGNFMPPKPNLSLIGLDEFVNKPKVVEDCEAKPSEETSKDVRKNTDAPIIEDWVSNNEEEEVTQPKVMMKTVKPSVAKIEFVKPIQQEKTARKTAEPGNLQIDLQDKGVIDSGCSRHMTGNMSYLTNNEEIDEGYVAFGGKIIGKGTIKTGTLEFKNVYFVRELKFNLFSVLQICDKKNSVLFNDTECIVLSPNFKLIDESQVLLRVPRKNNMYSVDLKSIVPKGGLTCLFTNATSDESKLWHRRLGHLNFKTMNKLVKRNLVRGFPFKLFENDQTCVACQKGKQHRASCKTKTENSISLPLHLLHMDLFGPIFVKSLMKKMYCLVVTDDYSRFTWVFFSSTKDETSGILTSFITRIENLVDHKVKVIRYDNGTEFKNKKMNQFCEMKGILRQYSMARTPQQNRVVERRNRTLIKAARTMLADFKFSENTPNVVGSGPDWLFNIDALTRTMNYEPITAGTQSNGFAGTKECDNVGQARKETEPVKDYIMLPLWTTDPPFPQDLKSSHDDGFKPLSDDEKKVDEDPSKESECKDSEKEDNVNNTNNVNVIGTNEVNVVGGKTSIELPDDPNMPALEDVIIFNFSNDDEYDDAVADTNNLDTTIQVSHIPTTRIHKDHPLNLVIGDLHSTTQTRQMSKNLEKHGFVSTILKQRTSHKDLQNCLFACFLSQEEPKKVIHALKDPSWIESMQEELLQFRVDGKEIIIIESSVRRDLRLADEDGVDCLPNSTIFENLELMGMLVQNLVGEGSSLPSDPQHTPIILESSSSQPQKTQKHWKPKRKNTQVPQPSGSPDIVADEAVYQELDDRLVRAATIASSLEAEQDNGGGLRCQEATRIQLLKLGLRMYLNNPMIHRSQEKRKIDDIDVDNDIEVFVDKDDADKEVNAAGELNAASIATTKMLLTKAKEEQILAREKAQKELEANIALIETWDDVQAKIYADYQLAERLQEEGQQELTDAEKATLFMQLLEKRRKFFAAKRAEERRNKPPTQTQQRKIMCTYLKNMEGKKLKDLKNNSKRAGEELTQKSTKKQKVDDDKETTELKQLMKIIPDEEDVAINAIPLPVKPSLIVDWKIYKEGKKSYYQIIRADGKSKMYMFFSQMLQSFDREDLEDLYKLRRIVRIKSHLNAVGITAAHIDVNTAQLDGINTRSAFFIPDSPQDEPIIVTNESEEEEVDKGDTHDTSHDVYEDTSVPPPPSPKSAQIQKLMAQVQLLQSQKDKAKVEAEIASLKARPYSTTEDVPSAGQATASPAEGEKNIKNADTSLKDDLVDLLGKNIVTQYYTKKLLFDKYYDKMLKRKKIPKITNCKVLTKKGPITMKIYRKDGSDEVISNLKKLKRIVLLQEGLQGGKRLLMSKGINQSPWELLLLKLV